MNDFFSTYTNYLENASLLSDKDRLSHAMLKTVSSVSGRSRYRETVRHGGTCFLKLKIFASEPQILSVVKKYFIFFGEFHLVRFKEKKCLLSTCLSQHTLVGPFFQLMVLSHGNGMVSPPCTATAAHERSSPRWRPQFRAWQKCFRQASYFIKHYRMTI